MKATADGFRCGMNVDSLDVPRSLMAQAVREIVEERFVIVLSDQFDRAIPPVPNLAIKAKLLGHPLHEGPKTYALNPTPHYDPLRRHR